MKVTKETIHLVENIGVRAWPAEIEMPFYSWKIRANKGVTKRANSVFTIGNLPENANWLEEVEIFYNEQSISPCFYITKLSPKSIDPLLANEGYEKVVEIFILYHQTNDIVQSVKTNERLNVEVEQEASTAWVNSFLTLEGHHEDMRHSLESIFHRINLNKAFITLYKDNTVVAVGTIAATSGWGYISNVVVSEQFRRRGIGSELIRQLALWAKHNDVPNIFLQVLKENKVGIKLYEQLGFSLLTESYYRMK